MRSPVGQRGALEGIVATTAFLAISEQSVQQQISPITEAALEHVWTRQNEEGCWDWLKCDWPPFEVDDHFGATLMAIATGMLPKDAFSTSASRKGRARLLNYLKRTKPENLHQKGMLLWAAQHHDSLLSKRQRSAWTQELLEAQQEDGGLSLAQLGSGQWERHDGSAQDTTSDAYATGFAVFVLRQAGIEAADPRIARAVEWLRQNQRASGRWFTRSPRKDNKHYITHAASNFAVMALAACGQGENGG